MDKSELQEELDSRARACEGDEKERHLLAAFLRDLKTEERTLAQDKVSSVIFKAVSPAVETLLRDVGVSPCTVLEDIVLKGIFSEEQLAQEVCAAACDQDGWRSTLRPQLEVVGVLVDANEDIEGRAAERLRKAAPTVDKLRKLSTGELNLKVADLSEKAQHAVRQLHSEGHALRAKALALKLDPCVASFLEEHGIVDFDSVTDVAQERELERIFLEEHPSKNSLEVRRLLRNKLLPQVHSKCASNISNVKVCIDETKKLLEDLQKSSGAASQHVLTQIALKLGLHGGIMKEFLAERSTNPDALQRLTNVLADAQRLAAAPNRSSNEAVVAAASQGLIAYGVQSMGYGFGAPPERVVSPLLQNPECVEWLEEEGSAGTSKTYYALSEWGIDAFLQALQMGGLEWAEASAVGGAFFPLLSVKDDQSRAPDSKRLSKYAVLVQVQSSPVRAFRVEADCMVLSDEAEGALDALAHEMSLTAAQNFLATFGDAVPSAVQTLGGIFCRTVRVRTETACEVSILKEIMLSHLQNDHTSVLQSILASDAISSWTSATWAGPTGCQYKYNTETRPLGPPMHTAAIFQELLLKTNSHWHIISRGKRDSFIPVWKLVANLWKDEHAEKVAGLLRGVWHQKARICNFKLTSSSKRMLQDAVKSSDPSLQDGGVLHNSILGAVEHHMIEFDLAGRTQSCSEWKEEDRSVEMLASLITRAGAIQQTEGPHTPVLALLFQHKSFLAWLDKSVLGSTSGGGEEAFRYTRLLFKDIFAREGVRQKLLSSLQKQSGVDDMSSVVAFLTSTACLDEEVVIELEVKDLPGKLRRLRESEEDDDGITRRAEQYIRAAFRSLNRRSGQTHVEAKLRELLADFSYAGQDDGSFRGNLDKVAQQHLEEVLVDAFCSHYAAGEIVEKDFPAGLWGRHGVVEEKYHAVGAVQNLTDLTVTVDWLQVFTSQGHKVELLAGKDIPPTKCYVWEVSRCSAKPQPQVAWKDLEDQAAEAEEPPAPLHILGDQAFADGTLADRLRWRLTGYGSGSTVEALDDDDEDSDGWLDLSDDEEPSTNASPTSAAQEWRNLLEHAELVDVVTVFNMLLDQRQPVPLYWCRQDGFKKSLLHAMCFVSVRGLHGRDMIQLLRSSMPRIAYACSPTVRRPETALLANAHFHTQFEDSAHASRDGVVEVAMGFQEKPEAGMTKKYEPILVFLVRGGLETLYASGVAEMATRIFLQVNGDYAGPPDELKGKCVWAFEVTSHGKTDPSKRLLRMTTSDLQGLFNTPKRFSKMFADAPTCGVTFHDIIAADALHKAGWTSWERTQRELLENLDVRKERGRLVLQAKFEMECKKQRELRKLKGADCPRKGVLQRDIAQLQQQRRQLACQSSHTAVVQLAISALSRSTRVQRVLRISLLAQELQRLSELQGQDLQCAKDIAHEELSRASTPDERHFCQKQLVEALVQYAGSSLDLANVFREIGHIYTARPQDAHYYPQLAAQHLVDGGAVEFMDGEAGAVNRDWIFAVLRELDKLLERHLGRKATFIVRSVLGRQSCGKSTVLNIMFGCTLRTSAGICTRGVNMFLVPCYRSDSPYDFILGLDTEGICSPQFLGRDDYDENNNIMAMISMLHADSCLLIAEGEGIEEFANVLPIVMLAYQSSAMASRMEGRMATRMFFLHNKIAQKAAGGSSFRDASNRFRQHLLDQEKSVQEGNENFRSTLRDLSIEDDIRYAGRLNKGDPPSDSPEQSYGQCLAEFNDHMYNTLRGSTESNTVQAARGITLDTFMGRMADVLDCVDEADRYVKFKQLAKWKLKKKLDDRMNVFKMQAGEELGKVYHNFLKDLMTDASVAQTHGSYETDLQPKVQSDLNSAVKGINEEVEEYLDVQEHAEFKLDLQREWQDLVKDEKEKKHRDLRNAWAVKHTLDPKVKECQEMIKYKLQQLRDGRGKWQSLPDDEQVLQQEFDKVFFTVVQEAEKHAKGTHVESEIGRLYLSNEIYCAGTMRYASESGVLQSAWDSLKELFNWGGSAEEVQNAITHIVHAIEKGCVKYDSSTVLAAIQSTEALLDRHKVFQLRKRHRLHAVVREEMTRILKRKQTEHDRKYNLVVALKAKRTTMLQNFKLLCRGIKGTESVRLSLEAALRSALESSFDEMVVRHTKELVLLQPWARSNEAAFAETMLPLVEKYRAGRKKCVLESLNDEKLLERKMSELVEHCVKERECFRATVKVVEKALAQARAAFDEACASGHTDVWLLHQY